MITRTLTWKTTVRFAALVTVTTALVLAAGGWLLQRQMRRGLGVLHEGEARELLGFLAGAARTPEAVRARVLRDSEGDAEWFFIQIHDADGRVLFRSANLGTAILPDLSPASERRVVKLAGVGEVQLSELREDGWHIQVGSPLTAEHLLVTDYVQVSVVLLGVAGFGALALGYGFSRVTLRPLRAIAETARRIGGENLRERIPVPDTKDELAELGRLLNQTFDRLETSFEQVRRFSADASHELKTPLALMRLNAERLRGRLARGEADETAVDDIVESVGRMQTVIERLLFIARADGGALPIDFKPVAPGRLAAELKEDADALLEEAGARFRVGVCADGELRGDAALLRQLLLNLVANAATPAGGRGGVHRHAGRGRLAADGDGRGPGIAGGAVGTDFRSLRALHGGRGGGGRARGGRRGGARAGAGDLSEHRASARRHDPRPQPRRRETGAAGGGGAAGVRWGKRRMNANARRLASGRGLSLVIAKCLDEISAPKGPEMVRGAPVPGAPAGVSPAVSER